MTTARPFLYYQNTDKASQLDVAPSFSVLCNLIASARDASAVIVATILRALRRSALFMNDVGFP